MTASKINLLGLCYPSLTLKADTNHVCVCVCVCVCECVCVMYLHNSKRPFELCKSVSDTSHFERRETYKMINLLKGTIDTSSNHTIYLFKCKQCQYVFPYVGSTKTNFRYRTNNCKSTHRKFRKN